MPFHLAIFSQFSENPPAEYIWFGPWMVRAQHLDPYGMGIMKTLRHVPGLRKRMIVALWNGARFYPSMRYSFPFSYDALQISADGFRARGFLIDQNKTVKTVFRNSRYGENTAHELDIRGGLLQSSDFKIPKILSSQENGDYMQFEEEFIPGRSYHHVRDSHFFEEQVSQPLMKVAERQGIGRKALCDVVDARQVATILNSALADDAVEKGKALLSANPMVAASFSHGDLVPSNMITARDGIYVVDWERSAERYAGYDQARLYLKHPKNAHYAACAHDVFARYQDSHFTLNDAAIIRRAYAAARKAEVKKA